MIRLEMLRQWVCLLVLVGMATGVFAEDEADPILTAGSNIRVMGIHPDVWVEGQFVRATADSFVMHDARLGDDISVPINLIRGMQILTPISANAVRLRRAKRVSMIAGSVLGIGVIGCLQACNDGGEVIETVITWAAVTAGGGLLAYQLPAEPGKGWRKISLKPGVALQSRGKPMLVLRWDL